LKLSEKSILLIGPYPEGFHHQVGGATILFKNLVEFLAKNNLLHSFISTNYYHFYGGIVFNYFIAVFKSIFKIPRIDLIFLNFNRRGFYYIGPLILLFSRIFNRKIALRMFGEEMIAFYQDANQISKSYILWLFRKMNVVFFETKSQVDFFKTLKVNSHWFPNCRNIKNDFIERSYRSKFVFISQIKVDKGIEVILDVFKNIGEEFSLEIYGPILEPKLNYIAKHPCYKGVIDFELVYKVLNDNDVLLLPTFHRGEGYPGIIIEAYAMSVPVITSNWKSIPEIVKNGVSGILVEPNSIESLETAIRSVNTEYYSILNKGAYEMSLQFNSTEVHGQVLNIIYDEI